MSRKERRTGKVKDMEASRKKEGKETDTEETEMPLCKSLQVLHHATRPNLVKGTT